MKSITKGSKLIENLSRSDLQGTESLRCFVQIEKLIPFLNS